MVALNIGNLLLEIGAEELPAGQILAISNHIKTKLELLFQDSLGTIPETKVFATPRRLFWAFEGINLDPISKEIIHKGPPEHLVKDATGAWTQAALGFAKKNNLQAEDLYLEGGYLCGKEFITGRSIKAVLEEEIPQIIATTPGTRFMRWASNDIKFARPLQWIAAFIVAAKETQVLDFEIAGLKASKFSYGHRFLGPQEFDFGSVDEYVTRLKEHGVYVSAEDRKHRIISESEKLAKSVGGQIVVEDKLLDELLLITENPSPILCEFDAKFLAVPDCVLQMVMLHHQRYIPIVVDAKLMPYFIAVSNNPLPEAKANIKSGNEKVIVPRFNDAEFFVKEDAKIKLADRVLKLEKMNFLKGNFLQKVYRMQKITQYLIDEIQPNYTNNPASNPDDSFEPKAIAAMLEASLLSKADLTANLVFEFTELQGEIGSVYAAKEGLPSVVVNAIVEHYKPRFAGDELPKTIAGKILSIADKLDNLVCAFALGNIPTGSADPFALRRQANGLLEVVLHSHLIINLDALVDFVVALQQADFGDGEIVTKVKGRGDKRQEVQVSELNWQEAPGQVKEFLIQRLPSVFEIFHKNLELNKAVLAPANPLVDLNKRHMMLHLLNDLKQSKEFPIFVAAVTRVLNLAKTIKPVSKIDPALFELEQERNLYETLQGLDRLARQNFLYEPILKPSELVGLVAPINGFFDNVLVNVEDTKLRSNRQELLAYASSLLQDIGDFSLL